MTARSGVTIGKDELEDNDILFQFVSLRTFLSEGNYWKRSLYTVIHNQYDVP